MHQKMKLHLINLAISYKILAFLFTLAISQLSESAVFDNNATDKLAVIDLKFHLTQYPADVFSSWDNSVDFCLWKGIKCANKHQRVVGIYLKGMSLYGGVSPSIGNLSFLVELDLSNNFLNGVIPPELGRLTRLEYLNLSSNALAGAIPANLSHCTNLITISLDHNSLKQQLPRELGTLLKLEELHLNNNNLTGSLPASLGNLSSLREMDLSYNDMEGEIPDSIGGLKNLSSLILRINQFSGVFPPAFYNLSSLQLLAFTQNNFHGYLRSDFGFLFPNIQRLWMGTNNFTGQIPVSFSNLSTLLQLNLGGNRFTGNVPSSFGNLQNLNSLNLYGNLFGNYTDDDLHFLDSLANCSSLQLLDVSSNHLGGRLKASITNLSSQLNWFNIYGNRISGSIPEEIAGLVGLTTLSMGSNLLTGNIPASIGRFPRLQSLYLYENHLTGEIPSSLGNLTQLLFLSLFDNTLEGSLPESFSNLKLLQDARFCHNKLNGTIPSQLVSLLSFTITLNLSHNSFTGPLPAEVGNLTSLTALDVSYNHLSGDIPSSLGLCLSLNTLNLENNFLRGSVPDLSGLKGLQYLDLSKNNLTAQIPHYFVSFPSLLNLNLSYNNFQGEVPVEGVFRNETAIQVYGNDNLCGGIPQLNLKSCPTNKRRRLNLKLILPPVLATSCLLLFLSMLFLRRKNHPSRAEDGSESSFGRIYRKISFNELHNATRGFSSSNLIGAGSFGSVYVGILEQGELPVAVKVLNLQQKGASRSFVAECKALGNIRHKNLVRILTVCSAVDYNRNDFKAVVYPYMSKGSLDEWLHPEDEMNRDTSFSLLQRMDIAIDIASALRYLHHQCEFPIIHCDLKPSNVLLDDDMTAHVSDFGMARLVSRFRGESNLNQFSSLGIKGTFGYIAPEYGISSPVSTLGDVYSYGILLLELFTGRRPVDEAFKDNFNLHNFVKLALLDRVLEIIDQSAMFDQQGKHFNNEVMIECLVSVLQIGIACSAENPQDRMNMRQVVHKLVSVKEKFLGLVMEDEKVERNLEHRKVELDEQNDLLKGLESE